MKKIADPVGFIEIFYQMLKEKLILILYNSSRNMRRWIIYQLFYESSITIIPKPGKDERKLHANILNMHIYIYIFKNRNKYYQIKSSGIFK